ncbi:glycosyltransferase family 2 protein [Sphingomonas aurantiaca]|uniref:glycosyltransferase family 2 protein n=1 Tax=Sphingomonas aurantiaca TaxID=185949 RepID=UPI002FE16D64
MASIDSAITPLVSISIISCNQQDYIAEAIESALTQTYPNVEVVVADDASTDETQAIIRRYERAHPGRVRGIFNPARLGITANSNVALFACRGDFVAFMGGDDVLLPDKIAAQVAWFKVDPRRRVCGHQVEVFYEDGSRPPHDFSPGLMAGSDAADILRKGFYCACAVMVRTSAMPAAGYEVQLPMVSDHMFWFESMLTNGSSDGMFGFVPGIHARYRRHASNFTLRAIDGLSEVIRYYEIVAERYPAFRRVARRSIVERHYDIGVAQLRLGQHGSARRTLAGVIAQRPLFAKAWVRLVQTVLPKSRPGLSFSAA